MKKRFRFSVLCMYIFLVVTGFFSLVPFYWMLASATNRSADIVEGKIFFGTHFIDNFTQFMITMRGLKAFINSLRNSVIGTLLSLFVCSTAGYGFQVFRSRAKDRILSMLLLSMMIPFASVMVPLFKMISMVRLLNTTAGFILPSVSTAFLIYFFRQSSMTFPFEIIQAARVDGMGEFRIYTRVYFPVMIPTFIAGGIVIFMNYWNSYLWPLVIMQTPESQTLPLLITSLTAGYVTDYGVLMMGVTICTLPTVILFFFLQKYFIAGVLGSVI